MKFKKYLKSRKESLKVSVPTVEKHWLTSLTSYGRKHGRIFLLCLILSVKLDGTFYANSFALAMRKRAGEIDPRPRSTLSPFPFLVGKVGESLPSFLRSCVTHSLARVAVLLSAIRVGGGGQYPQRLYRVYGTFVKRLRGVALAGV